MLYEPSALKAAEKATARSDGCRDGERALHTPQADLDLALQLNPKSGRRQPEWIDPRLAAIYVITTDHSDLCKIGYAQDLRRRMLGIQGSCPVPVSLSHFVFVVGPLVAKLVEADVHACLNEERRHGEWFKADPALAAAMIATVVKERGYVWWDEKGRRKLGYDAARIHRKDWERFSYRGNANAA